MTARASALGLSLGALVAGCAALAAPQGAPAAVPATQALAMLTRDHVARTQPNSHAHRITSIRARRPLTHVRTVLPVLDEATTAGDRWLKVRVPGRPNGRTGWIPAARTVPETTAWRVVIKLSRRRVTVFHAGRVARTFRAVVGKPSTPTPSGEFFVEEVITVKSGHPGGPYALATSALSNVFQEFEGGPGQVAIHGTTGLSGAPGTAASHGCIRLSPAAITWLAKRIDSGVPVAIVR
jgi:lipoprotein-anchoring transpeptidase ErfK/SrfK